MKLRLPIDSAKDTGPGPKKIRADGREWNQMRLATIELDPLPWAEGSALIKCGGTWVMCAATVTDFTPDHARSARKGWINAEYSLLPRATMQRTPRERQNGARGRTKEIERFIGRSLRAAVNLKMLAGYSIMIDCDVLRADAGTRCASVVGGFAALARACAKMREQKKIKRDPIKTLISAVSVVITHQGQIIIDPTFEEDSNAEVDMNIAMTGEGRFVELQGAGEAAPFNDRELHEMLDLGREGCEKLFALQRAVLGLEPSATT
jgi:ribonuclease PH